MLLWPVLLGLLLGLAAVLWGIGRTSRETIQRFRQRTIQRRLTAALENRSFDDIGELQIDQQPLLLFIAVSRVFQVQNDSALIEKIVADARRMSQEKIAPMKLWLKLGPALGLMGTLIPLGPALVGLAAGDLETMARNLQIAFATTVVGLLVSLIAYVLVLVHQRWAARDYILLTFAAERWENRQ